MGLTSTQREILSGLSAGFLTTTITHPLDLFKIRIQLDINSNTHLQAIQKILKEFKSSPKPFLEIYRGLSLNIIGNSTAWSIYFTSYRIFKDLINKQSTSSDSLILKDSNLQSWQYLISAFGAGSFTALLTNPIWVLKTRILSTSKSSPGAYSNIKDGVLRVLNEEGIRGFWKGLIPSLMGVGQGALQFTIYDTLKYQIRKDDNMGKLHFLEYISMSCFSKIIALLIMYPCQVLKSRLQDYESIYQKKTINQMIRKIYLKEGINGFYKGIVPNIIRVLPATCITFGVYEEMRKIV
ncbi:Calcium-binding mitochondrial carrier protein [Wickerhamomyces ciferrii]|uniref:Calcium-binding mitochondrial carrier protein n=1 Tax=Wickerhamomyces ciferrii (strain ATCC 14091 / BCRC 22168 / CBS 111 / JCM 3599 / NBRC 0793 / NRRL Y-1031 F-60-10) TaxID=1206466 RepID=K0KBR7_WICCF|nr:Calcium-binding mitochondrial carrier protein [Wickerhamomyces ciferrii]CCH42505.1 Calcium-binding mitochondrial carrier protein [Wickerhamomyces ciferrii]